MKIKYQTEDGTYYSSLKTAAATGQAVVMIVKSGTYTSRTPVDGEGNATHDTRTN